MFRSGVIVLAVGVGTGVAGSIALAVTHLTVSPAAVLTSALRAARAAAHDGSMGSASIVTTSQADAAADGPRILPPVAAPAPPPLPPTPPLAPIVHEGTTRLRDSMVAVRDGGNVIVHFDTRFARTRRPEKFEQIVRATLPRIYGPVADSILARLPEGEIARAGDLLTDLPIRGLRFSLGMGWALAVWPETRRGQDGPLVVNYRATVMR